MVGENEYVLPKEMTTRVALLVAHIQELRATSNTGSRPHVETTAEPRPLMPRQRTAFSLIRLQYPLVPQPRRV